MNKLDFANNYIHSNGMFKLDFDNNIFSWDVYQILLEDTSINLILYLFILTIGYILNPWVV